MKDVLTGDGPGEPDDALVRTANRGLTLDDLAYLNRMTTVGQVLPNVAHELNNALQVIGGLVEILSVRDGLPHDVRDKIGRIGHQAGRATELMRELVTFARREDAGVTLVDLGRVVERILAFRRYHLARARIVVVVDNGGTGAVLVRLEGSYVQQILLNLVINAEHSLAGRTDGRIDIGVRREERVLLVSVADNGHGLDEDLAARAHQPFFTTRLPSAGLGLTVAGGLAQLLGGALSLRPRLSGGTEAILSLPDTGTAGTAQA